MQQQEQLWPAGVQTYEAFELYAGLVQSRAFHMLSENWLTGLAQEGLTPFFTNLPSASNSPAFGKLVSCSKVLVTCDLACCTADKGDDALLHRQSVSQHPKKLNDKLL